MFLVIPRWERERGCNIRIIIVIKFIHNLICDRAFPLSFEGCVLKSLLITTRVDRVAR